MLTVLLNKLESQIIYLYLIYLNIGFADTELDLINITHTSYILLLLLLTSK